jgi:putative peptidoglycan lipid II flippase
MTQELALRLRTVALLLAASNLLSRILGYGRDWLISTNFGATGLTDVYQASFMLPDMLNHLLAGGALTVSLLPRMSALYAAEVQLPEGMTSARDSRGLTPGDRAFSVVFTVMLIAAAVLILVAEVFAEPLVAALFHGFTPEQIARTTYLTRIVLPAQLFFLCGGLVQATLLARQNFTAMALTPLFYNAGIIVGGLLGSSTGQIEGFSWGALAGAAVGGFAVPAWSAFGKLRYRFVFQPTDREVRAFLWTALPLMVGVSLTTIDEWLGRFFGAQLAAGTISWLAMARRVMLVPIGLLGAAAGQATGAFIAKLYAEKRHDELADLLARSVAAVVGLSLLLSAFLVAMPDAVIGILFEYGRFKQADTLRSAAALVPLAVGVAAWGAQAVLARAFYGTGDTWRPMIATSVVTVAVLPLYQFLALHQSFVDPLVGLALAATLGMFLQVVVLVAVARKRLGLHLRPLLTGIGRALAVATCAGLAAWAVDMSSDQAAFLAAGKVRYLGRLAMSGCAWALVGLLLGAWWRMPGMPRQVHGLLRRLGRA